MSSLCAHVNSNSLLNRLGPPFAFSVWVAARLLLVHSSTVDHRISPEMRAFVDTLREMGQHWKVADRYAHVLQRVLDEFHESESAPTTGANGERLTPSTVRILADMRRCAYDLDFLISRQPRKPSIGGHVPLAGNTPSRTPAPNELEYLDVFDFFNMPRLPVPGEGGATNGQGQAAGGPGPGDVGMAGDFGNVTNFMYDPNADWLR